MLNKDINKRFSVKDTFILTSDLYAVNDYYFIYV